MLSSTILMGSASVTAFAQANENAEQTEAVEQVIEEQPTEQPATEGTPFSTPGNGQLVDDKENDSSKQFLTVQTKNHFFFRKSGPELQTFFFELIFQLKFYLFKQIDDIHVHQIQLYILAACFADFKEVFDQDFQAHRFAFQNINIILSLFLIFLVFQQIHIGYDRSQR